MAEQDLSITDFLTDGQLTRLCEAAGALIDAEVTLRDAHGLRVVSRGDGVGWRVEDADSVADASNPGVHADPSAGTDEGPTSAPMSSPATIPEPAFAAALQVNGRTIGRLAIPSLEDLDDDGARREIAERFVTHLALTVSEVCEREFEQRRRAEELQTLYRLSSMLVGAGAVETMVRTGLRSAIDLLGADVGVIRLKDEESGALQARTSVDATGREVPEDEVETLPVDERHDHEALSGSIACVEAGEASEDDEFSANLRSAGFGAMITAGLAFRGRSLGVIDLYARGPRAFSPNERVLLQSVSQQLAAAIASARLLEAEAESRRVADQVKLAADVQRRMMPRDLPLHPALDIAGRYTPCFELGGDFYDVFPVGDSIGLVIGDVVGKGVAAALLMSHVRASLRAHSRDMLDLDEAIARTNQALSRDTLDNEFATLFFGVVDPVSLRLTYCNAGHEPPLIVSRPSRGDAPTRADLCELSAGGMVLGVDEGQRYQQASIDLHPGDVLFASTDGLAEAMNFENQKFGHARTREALLNFLGAEPNASAKAIGRHVHWEMRRFAGLNRRTDDTTILAMRIRDPAAPDASLDRPR